MSQKPTIKQRLGAGEVLCGPWCVIPSGHVMNIIASAGFDFVIIDREHGPASCETVEEMTRAAQSEGVSALVRLGTVDEGQILKALDLGADGVLAAHVETADDARRMVSHSKYHPAGRRGFSPFTRAGSYGKGDITAHAQTQNDRTLCGVMLEGKQGIENIDAILQVEHLDLVYIGAYDLSQALGMPGEVHDPKIRRHLEVCVGKIRNAGVAAGGFLAANADDMAWMVDTGMQFIACLPDCALLHNALRGMVDDFRKITK